MTILVQDRLAYGEYTQSCQGCGGGLVPLVQFGLIAFGEAQVPIQVCHACVLTAVGELDKYMDTRLVPRDLYLAVEARVVGLNSQVVDLSEAVALSEHKVKAAHGDAIKAKKDLDRERAAHAVTTSNLTKATKP